MTDRGRARRMRMQVEHDAMQLAVISCQDDASMATQRNRAPTDVAERTPATTSTRLPSQASICTAETLFFMAPSKPPSAPTTMTSRLQRPLKPHQQPLEFYNTTSTGHQQGSGVSKPSAWRTSRQSKINQQFSAKNPLASRQLSDDFAKCSSPTSANSPLTPSVTAACATSSAPAKPEKIFASCSIYISGLTSPAISDHRLKQLLSQNGAHICNIISRKTTTHVIVGNRGIVGAGAGGGLAAGKLQKEIAAKKPGSCGVKYVDVQWAIESLREGKRMSESAFKVVETRSGSQRGIMGMLQT